MAGTTNRQDRAFTLIELLVVLSVVSLLASILIPSLHRARAIAKETVCLSNLRSSGLAVQLYAKQNRYLPGSGKWFVDIAPFLDQSVPTEYHAMNRTTMPKPFFCPEDRFPYPRPYMGESLEVTSWFVNGAETDFAMGHGLKIGFGLFGGKGCLEHVRVPSSCMLLGETSNYGQVIDLDHPAAEQALRKAGASLQAARSRFHHRATSRFSHRKRMNIVYADGHVEALQGHSADPWPVQYWPASVLNNPEKPFYPTLSLPTALESPIFWGFPYSSK